MPIFDEEFFKKLKQLIGDVKKFIQDNWYLLPIAFLILIFLIILQQIILSVLSGVV